MDAARFVRIGPDLWFILLTFPRYCVIINDPAVSDFVFVPFAGFHKPSRQIVTYFSKMAPSRTSSGLVEVFHSRMQFWVTRHRDRQSNLVSDGGRKSTNTGQHHPEQNKLVDPQSSRE
jgi:hypothetical protein